MKIYYTRKELQEYFSCGHALIDRLVSGMRDEIGKRYEPYAYFNNRIHIGCIIDYASNCEFLENEKMRGMVREFDVYKALEYAGMNVR